jgi:predicted nucleotidyltransferase
VEAFIVNNRNFTYSDDGSFLNKGLVQVITASQKKVIKRILSDYHAQKAGVFGSYAKGKQMPSSDLDLIVEFGQPMNLLDLIGVEQELSDALGLKVDLVTFESIHELIRPRIEKEVKYLL